MLGQALHLVAGVLHREKNLELLHQAPFDRNLLLEIAGDEPATLNGDLINVVPLQLLAVLRRI